MASLGKYISVMRQVRKINKNLLTMVDQVKAPVEDTLLGQAALIAIEQRSLVAVGTDSGSSAHVKDTIRVERGNPTARKAIVIRIKAGGPTLKGSPGARPYDHARALEFGTEKMNAQPFFFPVYRARRKDVRIAGRKQIRKTVMKVFKQ